MQHTQSPDSAAIMAGPATPAESFSELVHMHRVLEALFLRHQERLVLFQWQQARQDFAAFKTLLAMHIYHEDEVLLPVFRRIGEIKRWPAELFSGEHRKLEGFLARIEARLDALGEPAPHKARLVVETLDEEGGLKRLMEHHDEREQQCLFPILDQVTEAEERRALLLRLFNEWYHKRDTLLS